MTEKIYIALIGEGTDVWRPVQARRLDDNVYRLPETAPPYEHWAFAPGSAVVCELRSLGGEVVSVATERLHATPGPPDSETLTEADDEYLIALMAWEESFIHEASAEFARFEDASVELPKLIQRALPIIERLLRSGFIRLSLSTVDGRKTSPWQSIELPEDVRSAMAWVRPSDVAGAEYWQLVHTGRHKEGHALHTVSPERAHYLKYKKTRHQTQPGAVVVDQPAKTVAVLDRSGIDMLIIHGPDLDRLVDAVMQVSGLSREAIKSPHDDDERSLAILDFPHWAVIHAYTAGDFGFKVDLDGKSRRDYVAIGRALAARLGVAVAWPDERTLAPTASVLCLPSGEERDCTIDDLPDDADGLLVTF